MYYIKNCMHFRLILFILSMSIFYYFINCSFSIYTYTHIYTYIHIHTYIHIYTYTHIHTHTHINTHEYAHTYNK